MGGWALHREICQTNKRQAFPGTGSLEGGLQRNSFSGDRGTILFPIPSSCSWAAGSCPPTQARKQVRDIFISCMAKLQPQMNHSVCFLLACTQILLKTVSLSGRWVTTSGSPALHGTKGWMKAYYLSLVRSHSYRQLFQTFPTPLPFWCPLHQQVNIESFICVTKCLNLPTYSPFLLASSYNWKVLPSN